MKNKVIFSRVSSIFLISLIFFSCFSVGTYAQTDSQATDYTDRAGWITPDSPFYFFDEWFTHNSVEECNAEARLMIAQGDIEAAQIALDNMADALEEIETALEEDQEFSADGVTLENLADSDVANDLVARLEDALNYREDSNDLEALLEEQVESGAIDETEATGLLDRVNVNVADVNAVVGERERIFIEGVAENNDVPTIEVDYNFEDIVFGRNPALEERYRAIADTRTPEEAQALIDSLRQEADQLRAAGDIVTADLVEEAIIGAEHHIAECLSSSYQELNIIEGFAHSEEALSIIENAQLLVDGLDLADIDQDVAEETVAPTAEDLAVATQREETIADRVVRDFDRLNEQYASDPARLAALNQEMIRSQRAQELGELLHDGGVMERWDAELTAQGLTGEERNRALHENWMDEWNAVYGQTYIPAGSYITTDEVGEFITTTDGAIETGRVTLTQVVDPLTGEVRTEMAGWADGEPASVRGAGGYPLGVPIEDPVSGITYTFTGPGIYTYTTDSGMRYSVSTPVDYTRDEQSDFKYGDERVTYQTNDGQEVTYFPTGVEIVGENGEVVVEQPYIQDTVVFADRNTLYNDPTGYTFTNTESGESRIYAYNPKYETYQSTDGKVFVPSTGLHIQTTTYNPSTGNYQSNYGGVQWNYEGDDVLVGSNGQKFNLPPLLPAPVGYEGERQFTTENGEIWSYDSVIETWKETTTGEKSYTIAPGNLDRYDPVNSRYVDSQGKWHDAVSFQTRNPWQYSEGTRRWVSSETGYAYDPVTGNLVRSDGTTVTPYDQKTPWQANIHCYGCYSTTDGTTSGNTPQVRPYTFDSGAYHVRAPDGSYGYVSGNGQQNVPTTVTDAQGTKWTLRPDSTGKIQYDGETKDGVKITSEQHAANVAAVTARDVRDAYVAKGGVSYALPGEPGGMIGPNSYYSGGMPGGPGAYVPPGSSAAQSGFNSAGQYVGGYYAANPGQSAADYYAQYPGGTYVVPEGGSYTGGSMTGTSTGSGTGYSTSGSYYSGSSVTGTSTGSTTGSSTSGSSSGETTSGSTSGGESSGSTSGSATGGSSSGESSGGSTTGGAVIAGKEAQLRENFVSKFFKWIFGK